VRPRAKVTIDSDSLQEIVYEESIDTKVNDLGLCSEVVWGHANHCVTFTIEYLGNR